MTDGGDDGTDEDGPDDPDPLEDGEAEDIAGRGGNPQAPAEAGHPGLPPRQQKAVEALLREPTAARAAAAVGVNERTLRRWADRPAFRRRCCGPAARRSGTRSG